MATYNAENEIIKVMQTPLASLTKVDASDVVYMNTTYTPDNKPYVQVFNLSGDMYQASLGTYGQYRYEGIFQIDVVVPVGSGRELLNPILSEIKQIYKPSTLLTNDEISVRCEAVWESSSYDDDNWYTIPVNIRYYAYTDNI